MQRWQWPTNTYVPVGVKVGSQQLSIYLKTRKAETIAFHQIHPHPTHSLPSYYYHTPMHAFAMCHDMPSCDRIPPSTPNTSWL